MSIKIDFSYLLEITGGEPTIMLEMIDLFIQEIPKHSARLKEFATEQNWSSLASEIHKMKPTLLYVGLHSIHQLALELEKETKTQEIGPGFQERLDIMTSSITASLPLLREKREELVS
ncbi:MAG: Hpt domain-containing protein [Bacteroidota bacterium]